MRTPNRRRLPAAFAAAALFALSAPTHAAIFDLGTWDTSGSVFAGTKSHFIGIPFVDQYRFTIAEGHSFSFSAFAETGFSNRAWIPNLDGRLEQGGITLLEGDAETVFSPEFPNRQVDFPAITLGAGDYVVRFWGLPLAVGPLTASYGASFTFAVNAPVPEPQALALMALGLAGTAWAARRRKR